MEEACFSIFNCVGSAWSFRYRAISLLIGAGWVGGELERLIYSHLVAPFWLEIWWIDINFTDIFHMVLTNSRQDKQITAKLITNGE